MTQDARSLWDAEADTFDDAADHGLRDPEIRRAWAELLLPLIDGRGRRVADLGCGTGTLSLLLASEGGHFVCGVDFSAEMIRRAHDKSEHFATADIHRRRCCRPSAGARLLRRCSCPACSLGDAGPVSGAREMDRPAHPDGRPPPTLSGQSPFGIRSASRCSSYSLRRVSRWRAASTVSRSDFGRPRSSCHSQET